MPDRKSFVRKLWTGCPSKPPTGYSFPLMTSTASGRTARNSFCPVIRLSSAIVAPLGVSEKERRRRPFVNSICFLSDERLTSVLYGLPSISQSLFSAKSHCCNRIQQKVRIVFFMCDYYFLLMSYRRTKKALPYGKQHFFVISLFSGPSNHCQRHSGRR